MSQYLFHTPVGAIQAHRRGTLVEALGIPYARAQRFTYPYPVEARDFAEPFVANQLAPAAPQFIRGNGNADIRQSTLISEDCQNLSVILPADLSEGERLPVMVYIHGGSYVVGSGDGARYSPEKLVGEHRVILVRVTYRLGILGFLGGTKGRPANLGLLDVREALRWVKRNIESFGGDTENITVFGQSAGGDLVSRLLISEGVVDEGLIHRAIIQSAPLDYIFGKDKMASAMVEAVEQKLAADAPAEDYGALAYKMQVQSVLKYGVHRPLMAFGTQPGHYPLPAEAELDVAYRAVAAKVPVLVGSTRRESAYFAPSKLRGWRLRALEPVVRWFSWHVYAVPAQRFVDRARSAGGQATRYYLETGHPLHRLASAHCTDLGLLFDNPSWDGSVLHAGAYSHEREAQGVALRAVWASFAKDGVVRRDLGKAARVEFS